MWQPHPKQKKALERPELEILYGGARGGGKTDAGIVWLLHKIKNPRLRALIIRRNSDDLRDWVDRANQLYSTQGAIKSGNPPEFRWPGGAIFRTGHLKDDQAYTKYQGHEYQRMLIEELTQIPTEESYLRLLASCRSTVPTIKPQVFLTTNPGNIGHAWVKERFIDPSPESTPFKDKTSGRTRIFIKSTIDDNPTLTEADPDYAKSLDALKDTNPELYRAWRHGDWDIFTGQVFKEFRRDRHVIDRIVPRQDMPHFLWMDWGYTAPFAAYASALIKMKDNSTGTVFNRVVTYHEWYGIEKIPDEWASIIYKSAPRKMTRALVDPSMLNTQTDGSIAIGDLMIRKWRELNKGKLWLPMKRGNNKRNSQVATIKNWLSTAPDGMPHWLITGNCVNLIRTLPMLVYDEHKVEEIDTDQEDHGADSCSYGLKDIKFIGQVGSFGKGGATAQMKRWRPLPRFKGKKPLDLDAFANIKRQKGDWRSV